MKIQTQTPNSPLKVHPTFKAALCLLLFFCLSGLLRAAITQDVGTNYIAWEAEKDVTIVNSGSATWAVVADTNASGGSAITEQGTSQTGSVGSTAQWTLIFRTPGTYQLFVKYRLDPLATGANSYKFPARFGGDLTPTDSAWKVSRANENNTTTTYTVIKEGEQNTRAFGTFTVAAGDVGNPLILTFGNREAPGLTIDRIMLSTDTTLADTGNGPFDALPNSVGIVYQDTGVNYIAWEAEKNVTIVNDPSTAQWAINADVAASGGFSLIESNVAAAGNTALVSTSKWSLVFRLPGTYQMYIKYKLGANGASTGNNSYRIPDNFGPTPTFRVSRANNNPFGAPTTYVVLKEAEQNAGPLALFTVNNSDLNVPLDFCIGNRECPGFSIDRIVLSQDTTIPENTSTGTFDALINSTGGSQLLPAPKVLTVDSRLNPNGLQVKFSGPVNATGLNTANYTLDNGVTVSGAAYALGNPSSNVVQLTTTALTLGTTYTVTVTGVQNLQGLVQESNPTNRTFTHYAGLNPPSGLTIKRFDGSGDINILKGKIANCTTPQRFSSNIINMEYQTSEGAPGNTPDNGNTFSDPNTDNYGVWIYGQFVPPTTGNYVFGLANDDAAQLWLSTDASPANKVLIIDKPAWGGFRDFVLPANGNTVAPLTAGIPLVAGQTYYLEALNAEGGGGDTLSVAVQVPGGPAIIDGTQNVIPRSRFATNYSVGCPPTGFFNTLGPISITVQPTNQTVNELFPATFFVGLDGIPAYFVQWYSNGVAVAGATKQNYSFSPTSFANGAQYYAIAQNDFSSVTSSVVTLTVIVDSTSPTLVSAVGSANRLGASAIFSEAMKVPAATTVANYQITNAAGASLAVTAAIISPDGKVVTLTTAAQTSGQQYWIVVANVTDRAGIPNTIAPNPSVVSFIATDLDLIAGQVLFRAYNAGGNSVAVDAMVNDPLFPNSPDFSQFIGGMNTRLASDPANPGRYSGDARENYGGSLVGHFIPPTSGNWVFYTSADDGSRLFVNTNGPSSAGKVQLLNVIPCCGAFAANPTVPIQMIAGQAYYVEGLYKEGGGGDFLQIAARLVGATSTLVPIPASQLGLAYKLTITQQPTNITVVQNHLATFTLVATVGGAGSPQYQWQRSEDITGTSFTNIPGANAASFAYFAPLGDDQIQFRCSVSLPGLATNLSSAAILTVLLDGDPPTIASIRALSTYKIEITFSERMVAGSPTTEDGNYTVSSPAGNIPVTVASAVQSSDRLRLTLSLDAALPCDLITVLNYNATDEAGNFADISGTFFHFLPFGMKHRYAFNNQAGSANGATLIDSVGTGDGVVQGNGASFTGSRFVLPGGSSASAPFGDLPNYMVSTNSVANGGSGKVTVEGWVKVTGNQSWSRIFDFGDSLSTEIIGVGGGGEGKDYFFYSAQVGGDVNTRQTEVRNETSGPAPGTGGGAGVQHATSKFNQMAHFAVTWDEAAHQIKTYENGILVSTLSLGANMNQLNDVNVWLGRSQWNGDANMQGEYEEFRVYDRLLSTTEMAANMAIGPDNDFGTPLALRLVIPNTNVFEQTSQQASIFADFSNASNVNLTISRCYTISSGNPLVITAGAGGFLQTVGNGTSAISVTLAGLTATVFVTVNADVTAPTVVSVEGVRSFNGVRVKFSELVDPITANEVGSYALTDTNLNPITVNSATLGADGMTVMLGIPSHAPGETYILTVYSVTDRAGTPNEIVPTPITFKTWVLACGFVYFEAFLNLSVPDYQNPQPVIDAINSGIAPSFSYYTNNVNWPQSTPLPNGLDNYGMHFRGLFRAPVTGIYKFEPAHDDSGNLLFSPDASEANAVVVMDFDCCSGFGAGEPGYTVNLVGGNSYFFDLRVIEAGGGDYAGLAVTLPSGQYLAPIPAQYLAVATPPNGYLLITNQSATASVNLVTGGTGGATYVTVDFNANNEGFVASSSLPTDGPWTYDNASGSWKTAGQNLDNGHANTALLTSPGIPVPASGNLLLTFAHRYSFEGGEYDGGQVRYSINGGAFYTVPAAAFLQNGYNGTVLPGSGSSVAGQAAFVNESAGHGANTMITSVCDLGYFNAGDSVQVQLVAASDSNSTGNQPVWEITSGSLTAGASPFVATFTVGTTATNAQDGANPPRFHQWYRNSGLGFVAITGANDARYLRRACVGDNGAQFQAKVSIVGANAVTTAPATLTVSPASLAVVVTLQPNGDVVVTWQGPFTLEETTTLVNGATVWGPSSAVNGVPFTPVAGNKYYRLGSVCPP